jgi:hypothetical protein
MFRSVKARDGWRRVHINRSYHSEFQHTVAQSHSRGASDTESVHTMALHDTEEFHHNLRRRANKNLALSTALSVDHVFLQGQHSGQDISLHQ